jgi:hypothetical protein
VVRRFILNFIPDSNPFYKMQGGALFLLRKNFEAKNMAVGSLQFAVGKLQFAKVQFPSSVVRRLLSVVRHLMSTV